jgi:hypothetical protein
LEIPNGLSEAVNQSSSYSTVAESKRTSNDLQNTTQKTEDNGQKKKKDKRTNYDLENTTQKSKDSATQTPLDTGVNSGAPKG